jgi:hypothetical protein
MMLAAAAATEVGAAENIMEGEGSLRICMQHTYTNQTGTGFSRALTEATFVRSFIRHHRERNHAASTAAK